MNLFVESFNQYTICVLQCFVLPACVPEDGESVLHQNIHGTAHYHTEQDQHEQRILSFSTWTSAKSNRI
jgi:hypothetical protein